LGSGWEYSVPRVAMHALKASNHALGTPGRGLVSWHACAHRPPRGGRPLGPKPNRPPCVVDEQGNGTSRHSRHGASLRLVGGGSAWSFQAGGGGGRRAWRAGIAGQAGRADGRADGRAGVQPRRHWSGEAHLGTRAWVNWDLARSCRSASWRRDWLPPAMDLASLTATPKANGSRASFDHRRRGLTLSLTGRCHRLVVDGGPVRGLAPCCEPCEPRPADEQMLRNTQDTLSNEACQCRNPAALHTSRGAYREYGTAQHSTESCCSTYVCVVVVLCSAVPVWTAAAAAAPSLLAAVMHLSTQHIRWMHVASTSTALEQATAQLALPCLKPHAPEGGWWATKCGCTIAAKSSYKQPRPRRRPFRGSQGSGLPATFRARQ